MQNFGPNCCQGIEGVKVHSYYQTNMVTAAYSTAGSTERLCFLQCSLNQASHMAIALRYTIARWALQLCNNAIWLSSGLTKKPLRVLASGQEPVLPRDTQRGQPNSCKQLQLKQLHGRGRVPGGKGGGGDGSDLTVALTLSPAPQASLAAEMQHAVAVPQDSSPQTSVLKKQGAPGSCWGSC